MAWVNEFQRFILRGNLVDMAVAFTVGAAFTALAQSLVADILMPPIGVIVGQADFSDLFVVVRQGATADTSYNTLAEAQADGAATVNYGPFSQQSHRATTCCLCHVSFGAHGQSA